MSAPEWPPAIFLMGPTASGKTDLAIELCQRLPCEIISVDSAMIYRGMDIGTAKPGPEELARAPHHLIDIRDPAEVYSAADFRRDALAAMADVTAAGRIPLLTGGTMMYFKALLHGLSELPAADPALRRDLEQQARDQGWDALHRELAARDPVAAAGIHPHNRQRLLRALEVVRLSGQRISELWREPSPGGSIIEDYPYKTRWQADAFGSLPYTVVQMALLPEDRIELHQRIRTRFEAMLARGFLDEVRALRARGDLTPDLPALRTVGYRQAWEYLAGAHDYDTMVEKGIAATRQLAKRQLTWLRKWEGVSRLKSPGQDNVGSALKIIAAHTTLI